MGRSPVRGLTCDWLYSKVACACERGSAANRSKNCQYPADRLFRDYRTANLLDAKGREGASIKVQVTS